MDGSPSELAVPVGAWRRPFEARTVVSLLFASLFVGLFPALGLVVLLHLPKGAPVTIATMLTTIVVIAGAITTAALYVDHRTKPAGELRIGRGRFFFDAKPGVPVDIELGAITAVLAMNEMLVVRARGRRQIVVHQPRIMMPVAELRADILAVLQGSAPEGAHAVATANARAERIETNRLRVLKIAGIVGAAIGVIRIVAMLLEP